MADQNQEPVDVLTRFLQAAKDAPDRPAVRGEDGALTFAELERRTGRLATELARRGVRRGDRVGVALARGSQLVVALLAVWRAGAAYVPLDPQYPADRLEFMAQDAGVRMLLVKGAAPIPADTVETLDLAVLVDGAEPSTASADAGSPDVGTSPLDPAYVIYTSGSTGRPKGVEATRGGVSSLLAALEDAGAYAPEPRAVAWNASVSFDASVQQWARVCRGDTVVVLSDDDRKDPARLSALLDEHQVTDLDLTPSHWEMLRGALTAPRADGRTLRLFMGGEPVPERTWREIAERDGLEALNLYGPTECTVDATSAWMSGSEPHIGGALPGNRLYVLDDLLRPVPDGEDGELFIGGPRLAHGYVNRAAQTADRFVADPFARPGERMYRTGDRVLRTADGNLAFLGRVDRQVKFRGYRLELGEIEHALGAVEGIGAAVVQVRDDGPAGDQLVAYCVPSADSAPAADQLRAQLSASLPDFMVPTAYVLLDALPLTPNGKLDTAALPDPRTVEQPGSGAARAKTPGAQPTGPFETLIAEVWADVLGRPEVSAEDDFFALGGHSLMALRVVGRVKRSLGVAMSIKEVYRHPRLRDLARYVEAQHVKAQHVETQAVHTHSAASALSD